jgi:hypothetical protein
MSMVFLAVSFATKPCQFKNYLHCAFLQKNARNSDNDFIPVLVLAALVIQPKCETVATCVVLP